MPDTSVIVAGITTIGSVILGVFVWRGNREVKRQESEASPYDALADRVVALERSDEEKHRKIRCLERALDERDRITRAMAEFIDELGEWLAGGQSGKAPKPSAAMHDHINPDLWDTDPDLHLPHPPG